jgi:hypothetical protein
MGRGRGDFGDRQRGYNAYYEVHQDRSSPLI